MATSTRPKAPRYSKEEKIEYNQLQEKSQIIKNNEKSENEFLLEIRRKDWENRIQTRRWISTWVLLILTGQLIAVFGIVVGALWLGSLKELELVLSVITTATIGQTYYIVKFIVKFVFTDEEKISRKY